jgi:hypothetical protein
MPISYEIDGAFAIVTCTGDFAVEDIHNIVEWVKTEPALPEKVKLLIIDNSTNFDPSKIQLEEVAAIYSTIKDRISSRWALVVEKKLHFGLGRMYSVFAERFGLDARVFMDVDEARTWLDQGTP